MSKKYVLLPEDTINVKGHTLFRIKHQNGELGGYIQGEWNLSHDDTCWIYGNAKVYEKSHVKDKAMIYEDAEVYGHAWIVDTAIVSANAKIFDYAWVGGNTYVRGDTQVHGKVKLTTQIINKGNLYLPTDAIIIENGRDRISIISEQINMKGYTHDLDKWKEMIEHVFHLEKYSKELCGAYLQLFEALDNVQKKEREHS